MFAIVYLDSRGKERTHDTRSNTAQEALSIGYELTRDFVASWFRVIRCG